MGRDATKAAGNPWYEARMRASKYKNHRLPEWREFCEWIKSLPRSELIVGSETE